MTLFETQALPNPWSTISRFLPCLLFQAAMCYVHIAALVAEFVHQKSDIFLFLGMGRTSVSPRSCIFVACSSEWDMIEL